MQPWVNSVSLCMCLTVIIESTAVKNQTIAESRVTDKFDRRDRIGFVKYVIQTAIDVYYSVALDGILRLRII